MSAGHVKPVTPFAGLTAAPAAAKTIATVLRAYAANQRQSTAHTKTRGEVRGGGRKPWRQKGTGRARTGSIRGPLWRTGGIVFGPQNMRNFTLALPKNIRTSALKSALALKQAANALYQMENWPTDGKTKTAIASLGTLGDTSVLIILEAPNAMLQRAMRNLQNVRIRLASQVTVADILAPVSIVGTSTAYNSLAERLKLVKPETPAKAKPTATKKASAKKAE